MTSIYHINRTSSDSTFVDNVGVIWYSTQIYLWMSASSFGRHIIYNQMIGIGIWLSLLTFFSDFMLRTNSHLNAFIFEISIILSSIRNLVYIRAPSIEELHAVKWMLVDLHLVLQHLTGVLSVPIKCALCE